MNMTRKYLLILLLLVIGIGSFMTAEVIKADGEIIYYVSPTGNDGDGSIGDPFETIIEARTKVRTEIASGMDANVIVYLRGGVYELASKLSFGPEDSGRDGYTVQYLAYPGEVPILDGGVHQTGWSPEGSNMYTTDVGNLEFEALYENEERSFIARDPNKGAIGEDYFTTVTPMIPDTETTSPFTMFHFSSDDIPVGLDVNDGLEVFIWAGGTDGNIDWDTDLIEVDSIDYVENIITLKSAANRKIGPGSRYYIQGSKDLLDSAGEFYLDKVANDLYYWPRSLPIANQTIAAPKMVQMIEFIGGSETNLVENIKLQGMTIRNSDYSTSSNGVAFSMIHIENAKNISIKDNHIYNSGRIGIDFKEFVHDSTISGNWIHDIGFNGVQLEETSGGDNLINNEIINNHIHDVGIMLGQGTGIRLSHAGDNIISHNRIHDAPRYGISIHNIDSKNNLIQYNDVSNVNTDSDDTGVIMTYKPGLGNVIDHNRVYNSNIPFSFGFGIYLDDSSSGVTVMHNVIHDLQQSGDGELSNAIFAKGIDNIITNNYFVNNEVSAELFRSSGENEDLVVERNIFYNSGDSVFRFEDWSVERFASADYQLLYNSFGNYGITGLTDITDFDDWRTFQDYKFDQLSIIAEPQFIDETADDYRLPYYSPAKKLGIESIDFANIGLLDTFIYSDGDDPLEYIYPISTSGETLSSISLADTQTMDIDIMGRTTSGYFADLSSADIDYVSSAPLVASVNSSGLITALDPGVSTITVTVERGIEVIETILHVLVGDDLDTVHVSAAREQLLIGDETVLHIVGETEQGAFKMYSASDSEVTITNVNPSIVSIDSAGIIEVLASGSATIEVDLTVGGVTKTGEVIINDVGSSTIDAYEQISPDWNASYDGLEINDSVIEFVEPAAWVRFDDVDFGEIIPNQFEMEYASGSGQVRPIEIRVDSLSGPLLGNGDVNPTGGWANFVVEDFPLDEELEITGLRDVYIIFNSGMSGNGGNFKWFQFDRIPTPPTAPWDTATYGTITGYADQMGNTLRIVSEGADIWGTSDEFTYVYQDIDAADADYMSITTTVDSFEAIDSDAGAGLMIREDDTAGSYNVMARIISNGGLRFTYRDVVNPSTWYQSGPNVSFPITLKLTREGDLFTGSYWDEEEWVQFGQISAEMDGDVMAGLSAFSHDTTQAEAKFSDISIDILDPIDAYEQINPIWSSGHDGLDVEDSFIENVTVDSWIRFDDVDFGELIPNQLSMEASNGSSVYQRPIEIRLDSLSGPMLGSGFVEPTGGWSNFEVMNILLEDELEVLGLHDVYILFNPLDSGGTGWGGNFKWFEFSGLPADWSNQDIGSVGVAGHASYDNGTFTVDGSGTDIWGSGSPDELHYVYTPITGDGEIVARVVSVENTFGNAKAGVMIREDLSAGSKYIIANTTPTNKQQTLWRDTSQGITGYDLGASSTQPVWVKLTRSGNTFNSYESTNGTSWTLLHSQSISMNSTIYAGLAVVAMNNTELNTSVFDNVTVSF